AIQADCGDPFGPLGGNGIDAEGLMFAGESCSACKARQTRICQRDYDSCYWDKAGDLFIGGGVACVTVGTAGVLPGLGCGLVVGTVGAAIIVRHCSALRQSCYLKVADNCKVACKKK
ncbi:MAG: hypothetical protein HKN25_02965, partial [Pyrinomonadaceae bacterium]|nr:hypothetical protein [Pyrinomonadaceae bacterium]